MLLLRCFVSLCFGGFMAPEYVFRGATDFSGRDMPIFALRNLKVSFRHVFASDVEPACRRLIAQVHKPDRLYGDTGTRPFSESDAADLCMWGAPCHPFSTQGLNRGSMDPRCLAKYALREMKEDQPRAVLMENVAGLVQRHQKVFTRIKTALTTLGHGVRHRLLN